MGKQPKQAALIYMHIYIFAQVASSQVKVKSGLGVRVGVMGEE